MKGEITFFEVEQHQPQSRPFDQVFVSFRCCSEGLTPHNRFFSYFVLPPRQFASVCFELHFLSYKTTARPGQIFFLSQSLTQTFHQNLTAALFQVNLRTILSSARLAPANQHYTYLNSTLALITTSYR